MAHMLHGVEVKEGDLFPGSDGDKWKCVEVEPEGYEGPQPYRFANLRTGEDFWPYFDTGNIDGKLKILPRSINKRKPSPATLEAESLAKRLERLRELIRVEGEISAHKAAGKALTDKHAALVAELYPVAPKAKGKAKARK
jgi:hypothetical protein